MDDQNKNLILATALSFLVILVWFLLFPPEEPQSPAPQAVQTESRKALRKLPNLEQAAATLINLKGVGTTMASGDHLHLRQPFLCFSLSI